MNKNVDEFGWYQNIKVKRPQKIFVKKIFYMPFFFWRKIFISFNLEKFEIINFWYYDKKSENYTLRKFLKFKFLSINVYIFLLISKLNFFFKKKKNLKLEKNDLILFGPYINNHWHKIYDFLLRLIFAKKIKHKKIFVPDELKKMVNASKITKFLNSKIIYYDTYNNYIFKNANYLTHIEKRNANSIFKNTVREYKNFINKQKYKKNKNYELILISRKNTRRQLLNEDELYHSIKSLGFKKIYFEKFSIQKQIEISRNAKVMIGYHGSGLGNVIFINKQQHLIDIINKYYEHPTYKNFSRISDINYKKFICEKSYKNLNAFCDVKKIYNYLNKILK